jgi:glucosylceramidase
MANFSIAHDQQLLIPYINAALAVNPTLHLWASPWTPPAWMKDNNKIDGGNMKDDATALEIAAIFGRDMRDPFEKPCRSCEIFY